MKCISLIAKHKLHERRASSGSLVRFPNEELEEGTRAAFWCVDVISIGVEKRRPLVKRLLRNLDFVVKSKSAFDRYGEGREGREWRQIIAVLQ